MVEALGRWSLARALYRRALQQWIRLTVRVDRRICIENVRGTRIIVLPGVFNGARLRTGAFLVETLGREIVPAGARVLDLGTGSGIGAIFSARRAARVVATDINPEAVRCAQINALAHHLEDRIETRTGDLFAPVGDATFDLILFNPPFYHGRARDPEDAAWRSPDVFERFMRDLPYHLSENGRALVVLSSDGELSAALGEAAGQDNPWAGGVNPQPLAVRLVRRSDLWNEILSVYEIRVMR